jgi:hypothetical protein
MSSLIEVILIIRPIYACSISTVLLACSLTTLRMQNIDRAILSGFIFIRRHYANAEKTLAIIAA